MERHNFKLGEPLSPELINELMNLSYSKGQNEVGHLPLPNDYFERIQVFHTENNAVNLSTAKSGIVLVEHDGSPTSVQPVTITITGVTSTTARIIIFVPRGADYPVTLSVPLSSGIQKSIVISAGSSAFLKWYGYGTQFVWSWHELHKVLENPEPTATPHSFEVHTDDYVEVPSDSTYVNIVTSENIKVRKGIVDFTVRFLVDISDQTFGGNDVWVQLYDDTSHEELITKKLYKPNKFDGDSGALYTKFSMTERFALSVDSNARISVRMKFASQAGSIKISKVDVTGMWIEQ